MELLLLTQRCGNGRKPAIRILLHSPLWMNQGAPLSRWIYKNWRSEPSVSKYRNPSIKLLCGCAPVPKNWQPQPQVAVGSWDAFPLERLATPHPRPRVRSSPRRARFAYELSSEVNGQRLTWQRSSDPEPLIQPVEVRPARVIDL